MQLTNHFFTALLLTFKSNIEQESLDVGSVTLTSADGERTFMLDIIKTHRIDDVIECLFQDINEMLEEEVFLGMSNFDLTIEDLSHADLKVEFYLGGESEVEIISAEMLLEINGNKINKSAKIEE